MKRILLVLLITTFIAGVAFAAGQGEEAASDEPVELLYYVQIPDDADPAIEQVIAEYESRNPNVTVAYEHLSDGSADEYLQRLDLLMLSGEKVDIVTQPGPTPHFERASQGMLAPLDDYIEAEGINFDDIYSVRHEIDGQIYGLPAFVATWYVLINKDHLDEAGLEVPPADWTWEDYGEYAEALTTTVDGQTRYGSHMVEWPMLNYAGMWSAKDDNPLFYEDGTPAIDHEAFKGFVRFRAELEADGYQMPYDLVQAENMHYLGGFFNERFSMQPIGSWTVNAIRRLDRFPHDFVATFAPMPRWDESITPQTTFSENAYYAIAENSEHKGEAYEFIRLITTYGQPLIAKGFSAEKGADNSAVLEVMMQGQHQLYDLDQLKFVINNRVDNPTTYYPEYHAAAEEVMNTETQKYLFGGYSYEEWLENLTEALEDVIANY